MTFEKATEKDDAEVFSLLMEGRQFLREQGVDQWQAHAPTVGEVQNAIARGEQYLLREGEEIAAVCTVLSYEQDYDQIDGAWRTDGRYLAVHRVAVKQKFRGQGLPQKLYEGVRELACLQGFFSVRADTHEHNLRMRRTFLRNGFRFCGTVKLRDENGAPRMAFELILNEENGMKRTVVAATGNKGKLAELKEILKDWEVLSAREAGFFEEVEETGSTFLQNAVIKAQAACKATGLPALADDSGLCVNALGGAPGIFSARYSGKGEAENRALLLKNMQGIEDRTAYFACALVLCYPDGNMVTAEGRTYGKILLEEQGKGGFGYDPLFFSDDLQKSFGVASEAEKNAVSHRARAIQTLEERL